MDDTKTNILDNRITQGAEITLLGLVLGLFLHVVDDANCEGSFLNRSWPPEKSETMPKKKRRKKKNKGNKPKSNKPRSNIPESASTTRFLIFLAIGIIMLVVFYYYAVVLGGFSSLEQELSGP